MKKISAIFSIVIGFSMIGMWGMLYFTNQIAELSTAPIEISFHLINEFVTAVFLLVGGFALLMRKIWARKIYFISAGMLFYSLFTANGYYAQKGDLPMTIMFSTFMVINVICVLTIYLSKD